MNNSKFWSSSQETKGNLQKDQSQNAKRLKSIGSMGIVLLILLVSLGIFFYLVLVKPAYDFSTKVMALKKDTEEISKALASRDLVELEKALVMFEKDIEVTRTDRDKKFGWAKNVRIFKINEYYSDSDAFLNAGLYFADALREMAEVAKPFADAAGIRVEETDAVQEEQGLMEAFQSWVKLMPQVAGQMDGVIAKVDKIGGEFQKINIDKYPEEIRGYPVKSTLQFTSSVLSNVNDYGPDIKKALTLMPEILGVGTPVKRYMIIMQNDKELRPTGGFMTNYATFKIQDALLQSDFTSKDMYSIDKTLDIIDATYDFPDPPAAYAKYLKVERWYARDMNASPDFVTSMDQFLKFYNLAGRLDPVEIKAVDGIFAIDTHVVKELLEVTGPVTVSGITYSSENVVYELEKIASLELREQANRKRVLGNLMQAMLINVFESEKNLWSKLIDRGVSLALRKHVLVYVFDPEVQSLVDKYNFSGRVIQEVPGDYSLVVSTNLGGDKTNWFTTKKVSHILEKEGDKWVRTVKIDYTYNQPEDYYGPFVKRFRDWVRVYAPLGSQIISVDGTEDGTSTDQELNKTYFTGYIELGPGETKTMTFKYYLPTDVVTSEDYRLTIQKQPGIDKEIHTVTVDGAMRELELSKDVKINFKLK